MSTGQADSKPPGETPSSQGRAFPLYWTRLPSLKIVRPPKGTYSPKVDERCFTYCSQSIRGRIDHGEPWCRTICLRRVFAHEVKRTLAAHDGAQQTVHAKHPLPPEGQNIPGIFDSLLGQSAEEQEAHSKDKEDVKNWEEGYYLWASTSRWAAQEKIDLMMYDLERQEQWQRYKEKVNEKFAQREQQRVQKADQPIGNAKEESASQAPRTDAVTAPEKTNTGQPVIQIPLRPFPDPTMRSILLPVPPPFPPIQEQIQNLLAPSHKLLGLLHETIRSGEQWGFAKRMWEKAQTDEPFVLARNVCSKMWEKWKDGPPDDSGSKV
ncbi:hypothetical protein B0H21DRAFT_415787 [Amylocystis lapponica]|nr:hypothetical protein B0H21DRAFT_415787 [Amylocystis lapponica]